MINKILFSGNKFYYNIVRINFCPMCHLVPYAVNVIDVLAVIIVLPPLVEIVTCGLAGTAAGPGNDEVAMAKIIVPLPP
jgi:hypothetical protein